MSASYPHWIRVRRPTGTTEDRNTGDIVQTFDLIYEGPADVQDEGAVLSTRVQSGEEVRESTATIFVPERVDLSGVLPEDVVNIMWGRNPPADPDDLTQWEEDAEVVRYVRLDNKLFVKAA